MTRRHAVLASITALALGGCKARRSSQAGYSSAGGTTGRIGPNWGNYPAKPTGTAAGGVAVAPPQQQQGPVYTNPEYAPNAASTKISAISRNAWTRSGPIAGRVNPMNGISKLTVHHEGWHPVYFSDRNATAARIEQIRNFHVRDRRWGDIGYHYIVDRAGNVWEGRALGYQGAHVSENNEHNAGILVLGNFDKQAPSDAQFRALIATAARLRQLHNIGRGSVFSHQELKPTACPGRNLQRQMDGLRRSV